MNSPAKITHGRPVTSGKGALMAAESRYCDLAMASDQAIVIFAQGIILFANDVALSLLGATQHEQVVGEPIERFFALSAGDASLHTRTKTADYAQASVKRLDSDESAEVSLMLIPCLYQDREAMQALVRDRRARQSLEGRVSYLARNDVLTDLPNRTEFRDRLLDAIGRAARDQRRVAVILLNLDFFRNVNEKYGNEGGDLVLREVATRIRNSIRPGDTVARVAGDGFALILEGLERREQAAVVINRIMANLKHPVLAAQAQITVAASAGIAAYPDDALGIDALLRASDLALYSAKANARGGFRFFFPEMEATSNREGARREERTRFEASLTHREREVMLALVEGNSTKTIARMLGTSPRTIESQRAQVMRKMEAESLVDLVRMAIDLKNEA
jgi:diguanylate cyclase (GGDEF)-like protein